ncbi:MAG: class I SAM-dependent methyltransferase [Clostridiales bacterium]|nr:class I SAM-dependent methyltransferase [Clostridiales bacterium]
MDKYTDFASVYDILMEHIPYDEWANYIENILKQHGFDKGLVLELGCGTGAMTRRMATRGYDMIGIDMSEDMLSLARQRSEGKKDGILYLCQDMREFELYGTVAAVFCVCDTINYMLSPEELSKVFRLVANYLDPGGLFIFDMDTVYLYEEVLGDNISIMNHEAGDFIWENSFYPDEMINDVNLTLFLKQESSLYRKHEETHVRRAYSVDTIRRLLDEAGLDMLGAYHELTDEEPRVDSERIYIVARERHQANKLYVDNK